VVGEIEEVDQQRPARGEALGGAGLAPDPFEPGRERRQRDVLRGGTDGAGILLPPAATVATEGGARVTQTIWERIENARSRWNVLRHPFYRRWSDGELTREELARYSGQYRHAVQAIATMSDGLADATPGRDDVARHAREEREHVALWDGFVNAVGGDPVAAATPETRACVTEWTAAGSRPAELLARLYAIESGQPEIARIKREGLVDRYGVEPGAGTHYFEVHEGLDAEHAAEARALIEELREDADDDALVAAAESAFRANWRLLDGV
jgi:pyrroloquinoline-quinone synthase